MTIEEARVELEALLRSLTGTQTEVMEAADAYALEVLERAALLGGDHGVELTDEYHAIRREIEELP